MKGNSSTRKGIPRHVITPMVKTAGQVLASVRLFQQAAATAARSINRFSEWKCGIKVAAGSVNSVVLKRKGRDSLVPRKRSIRWE
jgi:hypothetical protein